MASRSSILAVPNGYDQNRPYRLMFGWHPWGGSAQQIASGGYFGLSSVINGQAILVAPHALELLLAVLMREAMRLGAQRLV